MDAGLEALRRENETLKAALAIERAERSGDRALIAHMKLAIEKLRVLPCRSVLAVSSKVKLKNWPALNSKLRGFSK